MSFAPSRSLRFILEAKTGCASVGFAPMTTMTSQLVDRSEVLCAGGSAEGLLEAEAGGGVAHAGTGVDVVVAEGGPNHLLDDEDLLVGTARGGDAADGGDAVALLDGPQAVRRCRRSPLPSSRHASRQRWRRGPSA